MIFILGIERSATTWVASILDHHPKTDVYMEPLSNFISGFEQWPDRFTKLDDLPERADYFNEQFAVLKNHRRFLLSRFSDSPTSWQFDLKAAEFLTQKKLATSATRDFLELNYHRKEGKMSVKKEPPLQTVIKELRLNFNAGLIPELDDSTKVLVTVREMASCVRSILQQFKQGNLVELKGDLIKKYGDISLPIVCRYWRESYAALFKTLSNKQISHQIVSHTDLLKSANQTVSKFLAFLDLDMTPGIQEFLAYSNQSGSGKHDTKRSREALLTQMQEDRELIYPKVGRELEQVEAHPILKNYI